MDNKEKYRKLCEADCGIPLFSKDWWLDAVAGPKHWHVAMIEENNEIKACLPFVLKKYFIFKLISMPKLTPMFYIRIKYPEGQKYTSRLGYEKEILLKLIQQLPVVDRFHQKYHYELTNWLPFYWNGFQQTTRYTYVIENLSDLDGIYSEFRSNIRREIRKAQKRLTVYEDNDIDKFFALNEMTFKRQNKEMTYSKQLIHRIDEACAEHSCRKIFFAEDTNGKVHATNYLVWDARSAYYLMGGADPELRTSGASSLLMWEAIRFASTVTKKFDFEGSMIEPIERFFRSFGAIQKPYFSISKKNWFFRLIESIYSPQRDI